MTHQGLREKADSRYLNTDGDYTVNGLLDMSEQRIINIQESIHLGDALTKRYFDSRMHAYMGTIKDERKQSIGPI